MAAIAFPLLRLGLLAMKHAAKPLANVFIAKAKSSEKFKTRVCMPPAHVYNWVEVKMNMWTLKSGNPITVPPLTEEMAIELGANILGEAIIFIVGAGVLTVEYARHVSNEIKKQEALRIEKAELTSTLIEIGFRLERQDAQLREMTRALADLGQPIPTKTYERPTASENEKLKSKANKIKAGSTQSSTTAAVKTTDTNTQANAVKL